MTSSTTFVFVPGAWHPASAIDPVAKPLSAAGYAVRGVDLPSVGAEPPLDGFGPDVDAISKVIAEEADKGQDVVLFMHSYGGVVGTEACRGLGGKDREAAGKKGGVIRLIYCTAFMVGEGVSLMDMLGNQPLPWFIISDSETRVKPNTPEEIFYNDLSADEAKKSIDTLKHHSYKAFATKLTYPAYKHIPTTYHLCKKDNAIPLFVQEKMVEDGRALGVTIETETFDASHSPFLSLPNEVVASCRKAAGESQ
ncbi:hypothetical protein J7T55_012088 [Diaporthe amygdali]|uniref:uncharacterized protein n=1 Tax=Phomopsis amygdali TaxID=1214568 RepID=UPI0022FF0C7C|nr:uncharacterized protein J7T55_012088 [Diaporthe amygdali]KAJ0123622.1 hypothetical protein J7T55_012088 [Diaporthe amygdali]